MREREKGMSWHASKTTCMSFFLLLVSPFSSSSPPTCSLTPFLSLITPWLYLTFLWLISQLVKKRISSEDGDDGASPVLLQHANAFVINSETPLLCFTLEKNKKKTVSSGDLCIACRWEESAGLNIRRIFLFSSSFCLISNFSNYNHTLL